MRDLSDVLAKGWEGRGRENSWREKWRLQQKRKFKAEVTPQETTGKDMGATEQRREEPGEEGAERRGAEDTLWYQDRAFLLGNCGKIQWGHILQRRERQ